MNGGECSDPAARGPVAAPFESSNFDRAANIIAFLKERMGRLERSGAPHAETVYEMQVLLSDIESSLEASRARAPQASA